MFGVTMVFATEERYAFGAVRMRLLERRVEMVVFNERGAAYDAPKLAPLSYASPDGLGNIPIETVPVGLGLVTEVADEVFNKFALIHSEDWRSWRCWRNRVAAWLS